MNLKERDIEYIVKDNIFKVTNSPHDTMLRSEQVLKIMTKSIYDSIMKYHESLKRNTR